MFWGGEFLFFFWIGCISFVRLVVFYFWMNMWWLILSKRRILVLVFKMYWVGYGSEGCWRVMRFMWFLEFSYYYFRWERLLVVVEVYIYLVCFGFISFRELWLYVFRIFFVVLFYCVLGCFFFYLSFCWLECWSRKLS